MNKYVNAGWVIHVPSGRGINDFIASKRGRLHFVKCMKEESTNSPAFTGLARNTFIQNAFSNNATPVYAIVGNNKVRLIDTNSGQHLVVARSPGTSTKKNLAK